MINHTGMLINYKQTGISSSLDMPQTVEKAVIPKVQLNINKIY